MAIKTLLLQNNDLAFENNNFRIVSGSNQIMQSIKTRLKTYLGEWFLDSTIGVPYLQELLVKGTSISRVDSVIQQKILSTEGVQELRTYDSSYDNESRVFSVTFGVRVDGSEDTEKGVVEV